MHKLAVSGLTKRFGDLDVLRAIDVAVARGEFIALVGPSGCGKTTLLKAIAGFIRPREGRIVCDGVPVSGPGRNRGVVFQELAILSSERRPCSWGYCGSRKCVACRNESAGRRD